MREKNNKTDFLKAFMVKRILKSLTSDKNNPKFTLHADYEFQEDAKNQDQKHQI